MVYRKLPFEDKMKEKLKQLRENSENKGVPRNQLIDRAIQEVLAEVGLPLIPANLALMKERLAETFQTLTIAPAPPRLSSQQSKSASPEPKRRRMPNITLNVAKTVAKNSPVWLVAVESNKLPKRGGGAEKVEVVRAVGDYAIDKFTMDLTRGHSYSYKAGDIQGLTAVSKAPHLYASMAPDQYVLPNPEKLDKQAVDELIDIAEKIHLKHAMDSYIDKVIDDRLESESEQGNIENLTKQLFEPFTKDEKYIEAKMQEMRNKIEKLEAEPAKLKELVLTQQKEEFRKGILSLLKARYKKIYMDDPEFVRTVQAIVGGKFPEIAVDMRKKLENVALKEITFDRQVENVLKAERLPRLPAEGAQEMNQVLQAWAGRKHIEKVADKVAGENKQYAVVTITGSKHAEAKGFGIKDATKPLVASPHMVQYDNKLSRPTAAIYHQNHPRIFRQMTIQSGGSLDEISGTLNLKGEQDLIYLVNLYNVTMNGNPRMPLVVNCTDGIDRTGMVMTALMILDKYNQGEDLTKKPAMEQHVALINLIESLRNDRGPYFLRGTHDIPVAITLGYALIAAQKQLDFQKELAKHVKNNPELSLLVGTAEDLNTDELKNTLQQLVERDDIKQQVPLQNKLNQWLELIEDRIEANKQFQVANDRKNDYRKDFSTEQRDPDADGPQVKNVPYATAEDVAALRGNANFNVDLLNKLEPRESSGNTLLDKYYAKKGALYAYTQEDIEQFEQFCKATLKVTDKNQIKAAKEVFVNDINAGRKPHIIKKEEKIKQSVFPSTKAKEALREVVNTYFNNLEATQKLVQYFRDNKKAILKSNRMTEAEYMGYLRRLESIEILYRNKLKALDDNKGDVNQQKLRKLKDTNPKDLSVAEFEEGVNLVSTLFAFTPLETKSLADATLIYKSLLMLGVLKHIQTPLEQLPKGVLSSLQFGQIFQAMTRFKMPLSELYKAIDQRPDMKQKIDKAGMRVEDTLAKIQEADNKYFPLDMEDVSNVKALSKIDLPIPSKYKKSLTAYGRALKAYNIAANQVYLLPTAANKTKSEKARKKLQSAFTQMNDYKIDIYALLEKRLDAFPKLQEQFYNVRGIDSNVKFEGFSHILEKNLAATEKALNLPAHQIAEQEILESFYQASEVQKGIHDEQFARKREVAKAPPMQVIESLKATLQAKLTPDLSQLAKLVTVTNKRPAAELNPVDKAAKRPEEAPPGKPSIRDVFLSRRSPLTPSRTAVHATREFPMVKLHRVGANDFNQNVMNNFYGSTVKDRLSLKEFAISTIIRDPAKKELLKILFTGDKQKNHTVFAKSEGTTATFYLDAVAIPSDFQQIAKKTAHLLIAQAKRGDNITIEETNPDKRGMLKLALESEVRALHLTNPTLAKALSIDGQLVPRPLPVPPASRTSK